MKGRSRARWWSKLVHFGWRLDPTSPNRLPQVTADSRIIVMCNDGYASSLAAAHSSISGSSSAPRGGWSQGLAPASPRSSRGDEDLA